MVVYWEYAFAENALLDGTLLFLALRCARMKVRPGRLVLSAAAGGAFAVLFPLLSLAAWAAYLVKFLAGAALALLAGSGTLRAHAVLVAAFFALTFAFGGVLTAVYSFFGIETQNGTGFYLERAPVALIVCGAVCFAIAVCAGARAAWKFVAFRKHLLPCTLTAGERTVRWTGFADSGNCLTFRGNPVSVLSAAGVFALFGAHPRAVGRMTLTTVNGTRTAPVFRCDRLTVNGASASPYLTVGEIGGEFDILLYSAMTEEKHEAAHDT